MREVDCSNALIERVGDVQDARGVDEQADGSASEEARSTSAPTSPPVTTPGPVTSAPVTTPAPVAFADINLSGTGDAVPTFAIPEDTAAIAQISHSGDGNFAVFSLAADGSNNDLLVNRIGAYSGTVLFDEAAGTQSVAFEVTAGGAWTIVVRPVTAARAWDAAGPLNGTGDDVVLVTPPISGFTTAAVQHTGSSNFAIIGYSPSGSDLLVNEIGPYAGEVLIGEGTILLEVTADGAWTVAPS